jgi:TonB-dependent receptor
MSHRPSTAIRSVPLALAVAALLTAASAGAQTAPAGTPPPADTAGQGTLDEVVVTGLRVSLEKSLDIKRDAAVVLDSINATELGRFPDDDVADSLSHITGISISRTTGGEGMYVGVRGLGSAYNIVTLNNRILATDDDGRDLAFDILPADVISGADVLKSAQASALEGSIGGTVNLRSARPFDQPGLHSSFRLERNYNDMSEYGGTRASAFVTDTFANDTFGVLIGGVYSDTKTRTDALNYNTFDANNPGTWPPGVDGAPAVVAECCISFGSVVDRKKRSAVSATLEWKPSENWHATLDGLYTHLSDPQIAYNQGYYPAFAYDADGNPEWSNVTIDRGVITSFTANNFTPEIINQTIDRKVDTTLVGLNVEWTPSDRLSVAADLYRSSARRPEGGNDAFVTAGLVSPTPFNQNTITWTNVPGSLPNIDVRLPDGSSYADALASGRLNDDHYWATHYIGLSGFSIHDTVTGGTIDATWNIDAGPLQKLQFGLAGNRREKSRDDISNDWTGGSSQYNFYTTPDGFQPFSFGNLGADVISTRTFPNYMQGAGGSFPHTVAVFDVAALLNSLKGLNGQPNPTAPTPGAVFDFSQTLPQYNAVNSYRVREDTLSFYTQLAFGGERWSGNAGVRLVHTKTRASTAVNEIQTVTIQNPSVPTDPAFVQYSPPVPTESTGSYTVPLPSLNLNFKLRPDLQLRFGAARTMTRPQLNQLAPTRTDNTLNRVYEVTYAGNADLKPIKATQADLSLEWYYHPRSALTVAVFYKRIKDFITTRTLSDVDLGVQGFFGGSATPVPILYTVFQPVNGDRGDVHGVEVGFQHLLENGFGLRAQYTHTWSKAYVDGQFVGQLEGVAPSTASASLLYEKGRISSSVTWDYSGRFVAQTFTEVPGLNAISDPFTWVTATASFEVTKGLKLYVQGKNLTNEIARSWLGGRKDLVWSSGAVGTSSSVGQGYSAYGRSFTGGFSYRF